MIKPLILLLALGSVASAAEAVKELNYSLGANTRNSQFADNLSAKSYGIVGTITAPISNYVGISLNTGYSESDTSQDIESDYQYISSDIFLRDKDIGKVGLGFTYAQDSVDSPSLGTAYDVKSKSTFIYADYYMNSFTFFADVNYYDLELDVKHLGLNSSVELETSYDTYFNLGTSWYFQDDTKARFLYGSNFDNDYSIFDFSLSYQPELFKNSVEVSLSYSIYDKQDSTTIALSISYHFMRATLKARDREYR